MDEKLTTTHDIVHELEDIIESGFSDNENPNLNRTVVASALPIIKPLLDHLLEVAILEKREYLKLYATLLAYAGPAVDMQIDSVREVIFSKLSI